MKITVFILNTLIQFGIVSFCFIMLLVALNGYHESQANPGIYLYIILSFISVLAIGAGSVLAAHWLVARFSFGKFAAAAIAVPSFVFVGVGFVFVSIIAAIILIEVLRK
jgi:hypothetical protein